MRITMCGTANGGSTRAAGANILLETAGQTVLLDCGHSSVNGLMQALAPGASIDALLFSHLHFDHVVGLPELLCRFSLESRRWPRIFGPRDTAAYVTRALAVTEALAKNPGRPFPPAPEVAEGGPGDAITVGGIRVSNIEVPHVAYLQCLARKLEWDGGTLVYSGDTTDAPELMTPFALGADVLIHECYSAGALEMGLLGIPESSREAARRSISGTHSRIETVARIARDAEVSTLVLTHLLAEEDPATLRATAAESFKGRIVVANDGLVVEA